MRSSKVLTVALALALAMGVSACEPDFDPTRATAASPVNFTTGTAAPSPLVTVSFGTKSLELWPFTGTDFSGIPSDPINLLFTGDVDVRSLRAALMFLNGDRTPSFPDVFPFNCTWRDAIGGIQTAYAQGWAGSAIQLECGPYDPLRFHLRFFDVGDWTLANVHFEVLIPGTTEHQVLSWELAEQLVLVDFLRSGVLDASVPLATTEAINPSPFGAIPVLIYNGLPVELRTLIGGPLENVTAPVAIASDGRATILNVAETVEGAPLVARQDFVIQFDQVIPKPFCSSGTSGFVLVQGPVRLRQQVVVSASGNFVSQFHAQGHLDVTPVDPATSAPTGETYRARVVEHHRGIVTDEVTLVSSFQMQIEIPPSGSERGRLTIGLHVGPAQASHHSLDIQC